MSGMTETPYRRELFPALVTLLPGPARDRAQAAYCYRLTYRNPLPDGIGCVMIWEVTGGRLPYQIALEREEVGGLRLHCTCADHVFRAENEGRRCKHVQGLLELGASRNAPALPPGPHLSVGA
jgi:hypothetical protein